MGLGLLCIIAALLLTGYNLCDQNRADKESQEILSLLDHAFPEPETGEQEEAEEEFYEKYPEVEMPTKEVNGNRCIGKLEILALGLELPIIDNCERASIKNAPGLYSGSAYMKNMIIGGHNYKRHFGRIGKLLLGDQIKFTDMDGHEFVYEVVEKEIVQENEIEQMMQGEWDLTLFTCDYNRDYRRTVRCALVSE